MDFTAGGTLADGRNCRTLNMVDNFTRERGPSKTPARYPDCA